MRMPILDLLAVAEGFDELANVFFHAGKVAQDALGQGKLIARADEVVLGFLHAEVFVAIDVVGQESDADFCGDEPTGESQ